VTVERLNNHALDAGPTGRVFNIQRFSLHDGPGIRTTVFLKGCPLRCSWCHNPESQASAPELAVQANRCIACGACVEACPNGAATWKDGLVQTDWAECKRCGDCVVVCPMGGRTLLGDEMTADEVMLEVSRDRDFYDESGGGVTFSGGEPLARVDFLEACLIACKGRGYRTAVDTCGYAPLEALQRIAPLTDLFLYDVKIVDSALHEQHTGVPNERILENLRWLCASGRDVWIRFPLVPGINDDDESVVALAKFVNSLPGSVPLQVLQYHGMGSHKYSRVGRDNPMRGVEPYADGRAAEIAAILKSRGVAASVGG
jgi:pyruvate formate lyase activating enzyme